MTRGASGNVVGRSAATLATGALLLLLAGPGASTVGSAGATADGRAGPTTPLDGGAPPIRACATSGDTISDVATSPPDFYSIELVPTGKVTGTGGFTGRADVRFESSPFDVAVSDDGTFRRRVRLDMRGLRAAPRGDYVAWATPPDLDPVVKLGALGEDMTLTAHVAFPKFLLVVSLEEDPLEVEDRWSGPIVHRGMSRSGFMHTMAGHGPLRGEPCANYGF